MKKVRVTLQEILACLGESARVLGDLADYIETPSPIEAGHGQSIAYCADASPTGVDTVRRSMARAVICSDRLRFDRQDYDGKTLYLVPDPQAALAMTVQEFFPMMLAIRSLSRLRGDMVQADARASIEFKTVPVINGTLLCLFRIERFLLRHWSLPFGASLLVVAPKETDEA